MKRVSYKSGVDSYLHAFSFTTSRSSMIFGNMHFATVVFLFVVLVTCKAAIQKKRNAIALRTVLENLTFEKGKFKKYTE